MEKRTAKLRSMKFTKAEQKKRFAPLKSVASDAPEYPWGLSVNLDDATLKKLGMKELPKLGATVTLTAKARVTSTGNRESIGDDASRDCCLQITDLSVE